MLTDNEISNLAKKQSIDKIAAEFGIKETEYNCYGNSKAKVKLSLLNRLATAPTGKLIVVTAMTPTPYGEGKTVTSIGLTQALRSMGKKVSACLRQPSMGPVFGTKGGAAGGGYAQIVPMEELNFHLTGDIHAISAAHNLAAAAIDARLHHEQRLGVHEFKKRSGLEPLNIDEDNILWQRVVDQNDRSLRQIEIGIGDKNGPVHSSSFDITAASELMAVLALSQDLTDFRERIGQILLALDVNGNPITAEKLGVAGAMTAVLVNAIEPTLMQTLNGAPCFIHAGPFANIAHGNSSIIADKIALKLADYVVTEGGFGSDMGFEKFCNIKVGVSEKQPDCAVLVATLKSVKNHAGIDKSQINKPNQQGLIAGFENLAWHIDNVRRYGVPVIVAINRFPDDTDEELAWLQQACLDHGADGCEISDTFAQGADGGVALAQSVLTALTKKADFKPLYDPSLGIENSIQVLATQGYGAGSVVYSAKAKQQLNEIIKLGAGKLPVCMAKTPMSISHKSELKGAPTGFELPISALKLNAGAGFVTALVGDVMTMPGLGLRPAYLNIDIDEQGAITGL